MIDAPDQRPLLCVRDLAAVPVERADDRVRERRPVEQVAAQREVDVDRLAGREVLRASTAEDAEHERRRDRASGSSSFVIVPLIWPSVEPQVRGHRRAGGAGLGADRAQRAEPDAQVAHPRRVALEHVEVAAAAAAEHVAVHRRGEQGVPGDAQLVRRPRGAEDPEVGLRGRGVGARGTADDRDLVEDHVRAAQQRADPERAHGEHRDQHRDRDPGPLAAVDRAQDEVVHGADEHDVARAAGRAGRRSAAARGWAGW